MELASSLLSGNSVLIAQNDLRVRDAAHREAVAPVKYSELPAIVYIFRLQVQIRLRGTIGAVLSRGGLDGLSLVSTRPESAVGW